MDRYPRFVKGRILKKELLDDLRDYPREIFDLYTRSLSDGIICGLDVTVDAPKIVVSAGLVKFKGRIYRIGQNSILPYTSTAVESVVALRFLPESQDGDFTAYPVQAMIQNGVMLQDNEMELARYKVKEGARLRTDYMNYFDLTTEFNTLNVVNAPYAGEGQSTLHPMILKWFARTVIKNNSENIYDISFAMQCLNHPPVSKELLLRYIMSRCKREIKESNNLQLYNYLGEILRMTAGNVRQAVTYDEKPMTIIVD
jgi:hypothetical protein